MNRLKKHMVVSCFPMIKVVVSRHGGCPPNCNPYLDFQVILRAVCDCAYRTNYGSNGCIIVICNHDATYLTAQLLTFLQNHQWAASWLCRFQLHWLCLPGYSPVHHLKRGCHARVFSKFARWKQPDNSKRLLGLRWGAFFFTGRHLGIPRQKWLLTFSPRT